MIHLHKTFSWLALGLLLLVLIAGAMLTQLPVQADSQVTTLQLPTLPASPGATVVAPIYLETGGQRIAGLVFAVNYDQTWLTLDPSDANSDGIPDAIEVKVPAGFVVAITLHPNEPDGEVDVTILDLFPPLAILPPGPFLTLTLSTGNPPGGADASLAFASDPPVSASNDQGLSIPMTTRDGVVSILGPPATIALSAAPSTILANGVSTSTVTALVRDGLARPLAGAEVQFLSTVGTITSSAPTDVAGAAFARFTGASVPGLAHITASVGEASATIIVTQTVGLPAQVQLTASPTVLLANGVSTSTLRVTVADAFGHFLPRQSITATTTLGSLVAPSNTDGQGRITAVLTAGLTPGTAVVTIQAGGARGRASIEIQPATDAPAAVTIFMPLVSWGSAQAVE